METIRAVFYGCVQGVFFRDTTRRMALPLELKGFVKNLPDGTVELIVQGAKERIDQLIEGLQSEAGPGFVERCEIEKQPNKEVFTHFEVKL